MDATYGRVFGLVDAVVVVVVIAAGIFSVGDQVHVLAPR